MGWEIWEKKCLRDGIPGAYRVKRATALPRISSVRFLLTSFYKESVRGSPALLNDS